MKIETLDSINQINALEIIAKIIKQTERRIKYGDKFLTIQDVLNMYDPNTHEIRKRKDKWIEVPAPDWTESNKRMMKEKVIVTKTSTNDQQIIVKRGAAFLTGNPFDFICKPDGVKEVAMLGGVKRVYDNNKIDYKNNQLATLQKSETHCALLWYIVDNSGDELAEDDFEGIPINTQGFTLKCRILAKSLGDDLYAIWDSMGDMIGFLRVFTETDDDNVKIKHSELYLKRRTILITQKPGSTEITYYQKINVVGKIPIAYFHQPEPDFLPVQPAISRKEVLISDVGDTNVRYAAPIMVVSGEIEGFSKAGESGKLLEIGKDATVSLLEAKNGVESVKFEKDTLTEVIMTGTQTPDISFEKMMSLGYFSTIALKMLFLDPDIKVKNSIPNFGDSHQRSINYVKAALATFDLSFKPVSRMVIKPKIEAYMPANIQEALENLNVASGGPSMSRETAVRNNPLITDPDKELTLLKDDDARAAALVKAKAPIKAPIPKAA